MPPQLAEEVAQDLHTFVSEATSANPRKKWYELSAGGLIEASKTVAAMSGSITTAVKAILEKLQG